MFRRMQKCLIFSLELSRNRTFCLQITFLGALGPQFPASSPPVPRTVPATVPRCDLRGNRRLRQYAKNTCFGTITPLMYAVLVFSQITAGNCAGNCAPFGKGVRFPIACAHPLEHMLRRGVALVGIHNAWAPNAWEVGVRGLKRCQCHCVIILIHWGIPKRRSFCFRNVEGS